MPRNGAGSYSLPEPAFVPNTPISSSAMNSDLSDIATALTGSIAADGQTTITGALKGASGSVGSPSYSFSADLNTGWYRIGADNLGIAAGGTKIVDIASTGISITGVLAATGAISTTITTDSSSTSTGSGIFAGGVGVAKNLYVGTDVYAGNGTVSLPAFSFISDPDTGAYRIGPNNYGIAVNGTKIVDVATTGITITGSATISNGFTVSAGSVSFPAGSIANSALASPGGLVRISSASAAVSASIAFTSGITSTYRAYLFDMDNILPATDDVTLEMQVSEDGGSTWKTTGYLSGVQSVDNTGTASTSSGTDSIRLSLAAGSNNGLTNTAGFGWGGYAKLYNPSGTTARKVAIFEGAYGRSNNGTVMISCRGGGFYTTDTGAITAVRFLTSSGNITSGKITMYGLTDS